MSALFRIAHYFHQMYIGTIGAGMIGIITRTLFILPALTIKVLTL